MSLKRIFIGSSKESTSGAEAIARSLEGAGYAPVRWWKQAKAGTYPFDRLVEISKSVDGAILLCTSDEEVWYRDQIVSTPRDNVILEYGLFSSQLGRERTMVVAGPNVKLPSDIASITHLLIGEGIATELVKHFEEKFSKPHPLKHDSILVTVDPEVARIQISNPLPDAWRERTLYYGNEGAKAWLDAARKKDGDKSPIHSEKIVDALILSLENLTIRTFVSFGPGDGKTDRKLVAKLKSREPWLQYIPVDINHGLLQKAAMEVGQEVRVPIGILGDFEGQTTFIERQLESYSLPSRLFSLLGNTLGNLDEGARSFLTNVHNLMKPEDYFLMEVSLKGRKWSKVRDERLQHESYKEGYRRFICHGIARRTGESVESIVADFENRVRFDLEKQEPAALGIEDCIAIHTRTTRENYGLGTIRRFRWDSLTEWLKQMGFSIVSEKEVYHKGDVTGYGIILVKRTPPPSPPPLPIRVTVPGHDVL